MTAKSNETGKPRVLEGDALVSALRTWDAHVNTLHAIEDPAKANAIAKWIEGNGARRLATSPE